MNRLLTIILALTSASAVLATPIPPARRASGVTIGYVSPYPPVHARSLAPSSTSSNSERKDEDNSEVDVPSAESVSEQDTLDEILSAETPLPSSFLLDVPRLRDSLPSEKPPAPDSRAGETGNREREGEGEKPEKQCVGLNLAHLAVLLKGKMYFAMALLGACLLALVNTVVQRYRSKTPPTGPIRLEIDTPAYHKDAPLSLSADPACDAFPADEKSPSGAFETVQVN